MLVMNRTISDSRAIIQPTPSSIHLASPAQLKRPHHNLPPIRPFSTSCSLESFSEPRTPQELEPISGSGNAIIAGHFNDLKAPNLLKPLRSAPCDMHPNFFHPLVQSPTATGQSAPERFYNGSVNQPVQQNDSDARRQQQLFEYQPALLFSSASRLPPATFPTPRLHPSLLNYSAAAESHFSIHGRDIREAATGCVPTQAPGNIPLRVSDAINRPPPYAPANQSLGTNFTIASAVPMGDAWPSPNYPLRRLDSVQHAAGLHHPSPFPPPVQNETAPHHLPALQGGTSASQIPALYPPALAQPAPQPQHVVWPSDPPPAYPKFSVVPPKGPRRPRREILADIKHMIFIWRVDAPSSDYTYRPRAAANESSAREAVASKTPLYISPTMDPPLLCTFRLAGTFPTIDSQLEQVREKEEGQEHVFPAQTLEHGPDPRLVGPDGVQWLVEPSLDFPTLRSVLPTVEEGRRRGFVKVEEDDFEVFIQQQELAAGEFPTTLPALSYGSSHSSALPPLASIASPPFLAAPHANMPGLAPQHSSHPHSSLLPLRATPATLSSLGPVLYPPRASHSWPPPSDTRRAVDVHLAGQGHHSVRLRDRATKSVRPPPTSDAANSGPSDVLLSKNLMDVLLASVAAPPPKNYVCEVCNKAFERRASLETHMTVHNGQRPHKCPVPLCAKDFSVRSNYRRHLRTHGLDPRQFDCDQQSLNPESVLEAVKKSSGVVSRKKRAVRYSSSESDLEPHRGENTPLMVGAVALAAAGAGGNGEQPGGWAPPGSVEQSMEDELWIPESLRQFQNAHLLSDKPPFDLSRCGPTPSMPLPPVHPWGSPTEPSFEERNSYDSNVSETPYHPNQWVYRPRLPGPAVSYGQELAQYADRARSSILSHLS